MLLILFLPLPASAQHRMPNATATGPRGHLNRMPPATSPSIVPTPLPTSTSPQPANNDTTTLSWLPLPTLYECERVRLRWLGGHPPYNIRVMLASEVGKSPVSESMPIRTDVEETEAMWLCEYQLGNRLAFVVEDYEGRRAFTEEKSVVRGAGGCLNYDRLVPFHGELDTTVGGAQSRLAEGTTVSTSSASSTSASSSASAQISAESSASSQTSVETVSLGPSSPPSPPRYGEVYAQSPSSSASAATAPAAGVGGMSALSKALLGITIGIASLLLLALLACLFLRHRHSSAGDLGAEGKKRARRLPAPLDLSSSGPPTRPSSACTPSGRPSSSHATSVYSASRGSFESSRPTTAPPLADTRPPHTSPPRSLRSPHAVFSPPGRPSQHRRTLSAPLSRHSEPEPEILTMFTPITPYPLELSPPLSPLPREQKKPRVLVPTPYLPHRDRERSAHRASYADEGSESVFASPSESLERGRDATVSCAATPPPYEVACAWRSGVGQGGRGREMM